jgi:integrase
MALYRRGDVWWFKFRFEGQVIRESAKTASKALARDAERARRRDFELAVNRIQKRERMPLFSIAVREWLEKRVGLTAGSLDRYRHQVALLSREFGNRLVCDINWDDVLDLQRKRQSEGRAGRTVNYEITTLRMILKSRGLWAPIGERIKALRERHDIGRAISREDERRLLDAIGGSDSPALLSLFILTTDTGLRASEARALRRKDLELIWKDGAILSGRLIVSKSKTEAGKGRAIPLTRRVCVILTLWLSRFPTAEPDSYVFPHTGSPVVVAARSITFMRLTLAVQLVRGSGLGNMRAPKLKSSTAGMTSGTRSSHDWQRIRMSAKRRSGPWLGTSANRYCNAIRIFGPTPRRQLSLP